MSENNTDNQALHALSGCSSEVSLSDMKNIIAHAVSLQSRGSGNYPHISHLWPGSGHGTGESGSSYSADSRLYFGAGGVIQNTVYYNSGRSQSQESVDDGALQNSEGSTNVRNQEGTSSVECDRNLPDSTSANDNCVSQPSDNLSTDTDPAQSRPSNSKSLSLAKQEKKPAAVYACELCGLKLSRQDSLRRHQKVHSGERNYVCDTCQRCFALCSSLKQHVKTHSEEKKHMCEFCNRRFSRMDSLKRHLLIHSGRKEFACNRCSKSFTLATSLRKHMIVHTGEKVNKCGDCGKTFARRDSLQRHTRSKNKCRDTDYI